MKTKNTKNNQQTADNANKPNNQSKSNAEATEYGGRKEGLDPTRYGDWEKNGRCIDF